MGIKLTARRADAAARKLLRDLDRLGLPAELYEERRRGGVWEAAPIPREVLFNTLRRYRTIARQAAEEMEYEAEE